MKAIIFEGSTQSRIQFMEDLGCCLFYQNFIDIIHYVNDTIECDVAFPAFENYEYMHPEQVQEYDFVFWTGSTLNAYDKNPEVLQQIEQAKLVFKSGVPFYGSCWGLQMGVMASGGSVQPCKNGIEIGVSKNLTLTTEGKNHPMLKGRGDSPYGAFCVHSSETDVLPPTGATVLVSNKHSVVQGLEIKFDGGIFWGVQYHPEVNKNSMVHSLMRGEEVYRKRGILKPGQTPSEFVENGMIGWEDDLQKDQHILEIRNFIEYFSK